MEGLFIDLVAFLVAKEVLTHVWWNSQECKSSLELQKFVMNEIRIVFDFIHSEHQNMVEIEKASYFVFVFSSLQLKDTMFDFEYKNQFVKWLNEDENSN